MKKIILLSLLAFFSFSHEGKTQALVKLKFDLTPYEGTWIAAYRDSITYEFTIMKDTVKVDVLDSLYEIVTGSIKKYINDKLVEERKRNGLQSPIVGGLMEGNRLRVSYVEPPRRRVYYFTFLILGEKMYWIDRGQSELIGDMVEPITLPYMLTFTRKK